MARHLSLLADGCDGGDHVQTHFDTAVGVVGASFREAGDAVVAVAEQFNTQTVVLSGQLVKFGEQIVQHADQLLRRALASQRFKKRENRKTILKIERPANTLIYSTMHEKGSYPQRICYSIEPHKRMWRKKGTRH